MKTWIDVVESQKPKKDMQLPYFTNEAWLILAGMGVIGGVIGCVLYGLILVPFCK